MHRLLKLAVVSLVALTSILSYSASAQCPNGRCPAPATRYAQPTVYRTTWNPAVYQASYRPGVRPTYATPSAEPAYYPAATTANDPASFLRWLNGTRARYGLGAVGYDQGLANDAAINSAQQNARGLGHFYLGRARRQNSAWAPGGQSVATMWMNSAPHRAALLDPSIRTIGLAGSGAYWTLDAY